MGDPSYRIVIFYEYPAAAVLRLVEKRVFRLSQVAKSSLIVTVFNILGIGLGTLSNIVIAAKFGAGKEMDVYLAATAVPLFITSIFSSALTFTFIPIFAEYRLNDPSEIWNAVNSFLNLATAATIVLCIVGILLANTIMKVVTPGFTPEKVHRSAELLRWLFPIIVFTTINELLASIYYSNGKFVIPSFNKILSPLVVIFFVFSFHSFLNTESIIFALLVAAVIQCVLLSLGFSITRDFPYSFIFDYKHAGVRRILKLMTPLVLGMIVYRAVPLYDRFFLSRLAEGSISHIGYAAQLMNIFPAVIVSGLSVSMFPVMSTYAAERKWSELGDIMTKGIRIVFFLSIPFVVLLGIYGKPIIQLFLERGAFTAADTTSVYRAFAIYLLALPAGVIGTIVSQGFYALQLNRTIAMIGVAMMLLYILLCFVSIRFWSYLAIPIAYAVYHNCTILTTSNILGRKIRAIIWLPIIHFFVKCAVSALFSALLIYPAVRYENGSVLAVNVLCAAAFVIYFSINKCVFHLEEPSLIWRSFPIRLKRT